jgi:uncharacterized membrane protein (UPF0127 family)
MTAVCIRNLSRACLLGSQIGVADRWWQRLRGLRGRPPLGPDEGLLLAPCRSVHMFGMPYPLDVAFVDPRGTVVAVYHRLAPGTRSGWHRSAAYAVELPAGTLAATSTLEGDILASEPSPARGVIR